MSWSSGVASAVVAAPLLAGAVTAWARGRVGASAAVVASLASAAGAGYLLLVDAPESLAAGSWVAELGLGLDWRATPASLSLAILVALVGALVFQYSGAYFRRPAERARALSLLAFFQSAMLGLVLADSLALLFVFWELTGVLSFLLIALDGDKKPEASPAARRALWVTAAGGLPLLVAAVYLRAVAGTDRLSQLAVLDLEPAVQTAVLLLVLPAVASKGAQFPLHSWLPGAMAAPTPVSAYLHSATLVKSGAILLLYLFPLVGGSPLWGWLLVPMGAVTCLWGGYQALTGGDLKQILAWSTVSQLGLLTVTLGLGTELAVRAAVLHLFAHAVFKAGLFLAVGTVDRVAGTRELSALGGLGRRTPWLALVFGGLAASMAGVPPLAGFLSKELILKKAMLADVGFHALAVTAIVAGSVATVAYASRVVFWTFAGRARSPGAERAGRSPLPLLLAPGLLAALSAGAGLAAPWVDRWFLGPVSASLLGRPVEAVPLSLWYGLNLALLSSLAILAIGWLAHRRLGLRLLAAPAATWQGGVLLDRGLERLRDWGAWVGRLLADLPPALYLATVLALAAVGSLPLVVGAPLPAVGGWSLEGVAVVVLLTAALVGVVALRGRLARVLLLSLAGFAVALLYRLMSAPDLLLTQLLVEILLTVLFVLALRRLPAAPRGRDRRGRAARWRQGLQAVAALAAGGWVTVLILRADAARATSAVREVYLWAAPELAAGLNAVNVVLTDFRAFDTLVETLVVVVAAVGATLFLRRDLGGGPAAAGYPLLTRSAPAVALLAVLLGFALLLQGHDDPGGGFVAGLLFAITAVLLGAIRGPSGAPPRRPSATTCAWIGGLLILMVATVPAALGRPPLTHAHGVLVLPLLGSLKWHTALAFDLGVALAVAAAGAAAARSLGASRPLAGPRPLSTLEEPAAAASRAGSLGVKEAGT